MVDFKISKWIDNILQDGEKIIGKWWHYYATNKHLILFHGKTNYRILGYDNISITFEKIKKPAIYPISMILLAFILFFSLWFANQISSYEIPIWLAFLVLIGLFTASILEALPNHYYQIRSPDINKDELKKWLIPKSRKTEIFIRIRCIYKKSNRKKDISN